MPAHKGNDGQGGGRPKGAQNKVTLEFKEAINKLIDFATPQMVDWLSRVAVDDPNKALEVVHKFAQFGYPLLAKKTIVGDNSNDPVRVHHISADQATLDRFLTSEIESRSGILQIEKTSEETK